MADRFSLTFDGGMAADGLLDLYDAGVSLYAAGRVFSIIGHYYQTGKIISQAPFSEAHVYVSPPEDGSFRENLIVAVTVGVLAAPFSKFADRLFDTWFPAPNSQMEQVIEELKETNRLLRRQQGLPANPTPAERVEDARVQGFIEDHSQECHVLRSVLANSVKDMFRPVGRSADYLALTSGPTQKPISALDPFGVSRLQSEVMDDHEVVVVGVVNSFSRSGKRGLLFSRELQRGMLFFYDTPGKLPPGDDFSWSQYTRKPLEFHGRYVRWFDGSVKRLIVDSTVRLENYEAEEETGITMDENAETGRRRPGLILRRPRLPR